MAGIDTQLISPTHTVDEIDIIYARCVARPLPRIARDSKSFRKTGTVPARPAQAAPGAYDMRAIAIHQALHCHEFPLTFSGAAKLDDFGGMIMPSNTLQRACALGLALLVGGCATTVPVSVVAPARYPDASLLRVVYVDDLRGRGGNTVRDALETALGRHMLDGQNFFTVVRDQRRADGLYGGRMINDRRQEEYYQTTQSVCVRSGDDRCASRVNRQVTCTRYYVDLAAQVDLIDARTGRIVYSRDHRNRAQDSWCPGQVASRTYGQLEFQAAQGIASAVLLDVAPHNRQFTASFFTNPDTVSEASRPAFEYATDLAQNDSVYEACQEWGALEALEPDSAGLLLNLGICSELVSDTSAAENYYYRVIELDPSLNNRAQQGIRRARLAAAGVDQLADIADAEREAWD